MSIFDCGLVISAGISREVVLHSGTNSKRYLELLREHLPAALDEAKPDFVLYNAGTDCVSGDPLGALNIQPQVSSPAPQLALPFRFAFISDINRLFCFSHTNLSHRLLPFAIYSKPFNFMFRSHLYPYQT